MPIAILYGIGIWLASGMVQHHWWFQFACFFTAVYAMIHLNNINMLIRVYSRMVSVAYIMLGCSAVWLFSSVHASIVQVCTTLILLLLFASYQDTRAIGKMYYVFLLISLVSLAEPYFLLFTPIIYLLMGTTVYSMSIRSFLATVLGLITPYWFYMGWQLFTHIKEPSAMLNFLSHFKDMSWSPDYTALTLPQIIYFGLLVVLFVVGAIHFWLTSYMDKIRVRNIYASLNLVTLYSFVMMAIQPQAYEVWIQVLTITVSPIIAHFISLTRTRMSNIFFIVVTAVVLLLTGMNLWM